MKPKNGIKIFAFIEILIGIITLAAVIISVLQGKSTKPLEVVAFVLITSSISIGLGVGILKRNPTSFYLLLYFSSIIILIKILIFAKIITLTGALETIIPSSLKNFISVSYHYLLIFYFTRKSTKRIFVKNTE